MINIIRMGPVFFIHIKYSATVSDPGTFYLCMHGQLSVICKELNHKSLLTDFDLSGNWR